MKAERFDEYHKHGCHFYGSLVVVDYMPEMKKDPQYGRFGAEVVYDYMEKAAKLIQERQYKVKRVLLSIPEYVVEIE